MAQKPCLYRYNEHCIDTMNHCIDTCWYVSIHSFTECMFWSYHGPILIHEVWYRYRGLCIDTSTCCIDTNGDISNFCRVGALYRYMVLMYRYNAPTWQKFEMSPFVSIQHVKVSIHKPLYWNRTSYLDTRPCQDQIMHSIKECIDTYQHVSL